MSEKIDTILDQFETLGVPEEEARIFIILYEGNDDTALKISRRTKMPRTTVYRILDNLLSRGLITTRLGERGTHFNAIPSHNLELLIIDKENELQKLRRTIPQLQEELTKIKSINNNNQQVTYYYGIDGLKQVTYNSLKAKGELLTYEIATMNAFMSHTEAEKYRQKFVDERIFIRTLTNLTHIEPWTDISEMVSSLWEIRHITPLTKPFEFEILIYNDIYTMYRYTDEEIFCVEIQSQELADMQKQLFEYLWNSAQRFQVLDKHGKAELLESV